MKQNMRISLILVLYLVLIGLPHVSYSDSGTPSNPQLELAKNTFNAALSCSKDYKQRKKQSIECLQSYAAMRSKTKQKKLAHWLSIMQLISINQCNSTELQLVKRRSQRIPNIPHIFVCAHYYQKPFQKTAMVTIGQTDSELNWKIIAVMEL